LIEIYDRCANRDNQSSSRHSRKIQVSIHQEGSGSYGHPVPGRLARTASTRQK